MIRRDFYPNRMLWEQQSSMYLLLKDLLPHRILKIQKLMLFYSLQHSVVPEMFAAHPTRINLFLQDLHPPLTTDILKVPHYAPLGFNTKFIDITIPGISWTPFAFFKTRKNKSQWHLFCYAIITVIRNNQVTRAGNRACALSFKRDIDCVNMLDVTYLLSVKKRSKLLQCGSSLLD